MKTDICLQILIFRSPFPSSDKFSSQVGGSKRRQHKRGSEIFLTMKRDNFLSPQYSDAFLSITKSQFKKINE